MKVYVTSIKGLRSSNEDKHDIIINSTRANCDMNNINFFAVYDGHGGNGVSSFLKQVLAKHFMDKHVKNPVDKRYIFQVYDFIQRSLKRTSFGHQSGSTANVVLQYKDNGQDYITVINLGDSRCVICRDKFALPISIDHKPYKPVERHRIEKLGGKIYYDGHDYRIKDLSVSRAFGDLDSTPFLTHRPDVFKFKIDKRSDKFFVLACDGLWDVLSNDEVVDFILLNCYDDTLKNRINKHINIADNLARLALKKGSTDNITIIVIFLH